MDCCQKIITQPHSTPALRSTARGVFEDVVDSSKQNRKQNHHHQQQQQWQNQQTKSQLWLWLRCWPKRIQDPAHSDGISLWTTRNRVRKSTGESKAVAVLLLFHLSRSWNLMDWIESFHTNKHLIEPYLRAWIAYWSGRYQIIIRQNLATIYISVCSLPLVLERHHPRYYSTELSFHKRLLTLPWNERRHHTSLLIVITPVS